MRWNDFLAKAPSLADAPKLLREMSGVTAEFKKKKTESEAAKQDQDQETSEKQEKLEGEHDKVEAEAGCCVIKH